MGFDYLKLNKKNSKSSFYTPKKASPTLVFVASDTSEPEANDSTSSRPFLVSTVSCKKWCAKRTISYSVKFERWILQKRRPTSIILYGEERKKSLNYRHEYSFSIPLLCIHSSIDFILFFCSTIYGFVHKQGNVVVVFFSLPQTIDRQWPKREAKNAIVR